MTYRGFGYVVDSCPTNEKEFISGATRLNCGVDQYGRNQYTCVPNEDRSALVEFCYSKIVGLYQMGHCLETIGGGNLDQISCIHFQAGCPEENFRGTDLYKFSACSRINTEIRCFYADPSCPNRTKNYPDNISTPVDSIINSTINMLTTKTGIVVEESSDVGLIIGSTYSVVLILFLVLAIISWKKRMSGKREYTGIPLEISMWFIKNDKRIDVKNCRVKDFKGKNNMDGLQNFERQALEEENEEALEEKMREDYENNKEFRENNKELRKDLSTVLYDVQEINTGLNLNKICCQQRNIDTQDGPKIEKEGTVSLKETIITNWKTENKTFVQTFATKVVEEKLQNQNFVIVVGNSGSGKTAMIQHIALKYQEQGWDVVPIDEVREIKAICSNFFTQRLFIMNDPIGKEKLDELSYHSWGCLEKTLEICLEKSKMLVSCRRCVIKDNALQGLFKEQSNIVEIDSGSNVLTEKEKIKIIKQYMKEDDLSKDDIDEIIKTDAYFPLLCKLISSDRHYLEEAISLFKRPLELVKKEIEIYKEKSKEKYCALVLLSMFNIIDIDQIRYSENFQKRFHEIVEACDLPSYLQVTRITRNLKLLEGSFVKCVGTSFSFIHDFVMEVTTLIFRTDFPKETIKYASSDFLRKRVKIQDKTKTPDPLSIHLHPMYTSDLIERFFLDINSDCIFDVALNPCLRSKIVIEKFIEKMKGLNNLSMFYTEKTISIEKYIYRKEEMAASRLSRIRFISLEEKITPISILITYCHDEISSFCLKNTDSKILEDQFLLPHVCANGSIEFFNLLKEKSKTLRIDRIWGKNYYPIHIASAFHNFDIVERLLQLGADPNTLTAKISNPLIMTANDDEHNFEVNRQGGMRRNQTIECLIKYGSNVNLGNLGGYAPLHFCIFNKVPQNTIDFLISNGADINLCCNSGDSILHQACLLGHDTMAQCLLNKGININLLDKNCNTPLINACLYGHENIVKYLLANGANRNLSNDEGRTALHRACEKGYINIVRYLLKGGGNNSLRNKNGDSPLGYDCLKGHERTGKNVFAKGANINLSDDEGNTALHLVCKLGNSSIVKCLLESGADINACNSRGESPLWRACAFGNESTVNVLVQNDADVNLCRDDGIGPLFSSCEKGFENIVNLLLHTGADVNMRGNRGASAISTASNKGRNSIIQLLIDKGADVNLCTSDGRSPLFLACCQGRDSTVKLLLQNDADVNLCARGMYSPIYVACLEGKSNCVRLLLEKGADINAYDERGCRPIFRACELRNKTVVKLLIKHGADLNLRDEDEKTAADIVLERFKEHEDIVNLVSEMRRPVD